MGWRRDQSDTCRCAAAFCYPGIDFAAGQLATFAGLSALGDLDLDLVGVDQVIAGNAKAP